MIAPASRKLGKYDILQKLGRGGMADVYLAQDTVSGRHVALKLIEHADDADTVDSIEAERRGSGLQAQLAAIDSHVVQVYESGDVDGFFFVAMEYVDGQDLSELMRRGRLEPEFAVDVAIAVGETLEHAHTLQVEIAGKSFQGIIHGDIKPRNIRVNSRGEVRVLDFGIAKALSLSRRLTRNEFGSVPYGSPERLEAGQVSELSDLWSLAVMLYEMVTGMQPYKADTTERLERMIRSRIPPPPAPDPCPEPLRRIMVKAMAPDPTARYQTAHDLLSDLTAFRNGNTVRASLTEMDATRRTGPSMLSVPLVISDETRRSGPDEATRRTEYEDSESNGETRKSAVVWSEAAKALKAEKKAGAVSRMFQTLAARRAAAGVLGLALVFVCWQGVSSSMLYHRGAELEREIAAEQATDPNEIWKKWTELSAGNPSSWLLRGPRKAVEQRLVAAADRVIDGYRTTDTVYYENSWRNAREELARALSLDPDNTVRGKLRLTEGHLLRINGTTHNRAADLNDAVGKFTEAEQLLPKSPDPELGLARVYVYGLKDIDKAYAALLEAEKRGFHLGNREQSFLADGYRERADRSFWDSRNVRGMPQEKDQIQRSKVDYERALTLYQAVAPYHDANNNILKVQQSLDGVNFRLQQIQDEANGTKDDQQSALRKLPRSVPPWIHELLRDIWPSHAAKQ